MSGITLHDDGTATVAGIKLREPTLDDYADLVDKAREIIDLVEPISNRISEITGLLAADEIDDEDKLRAELIDLRNQSRQTTASLIVAVVETLGNDKRAISKFTNALPAWSANVQGFRRLQTHWDTVPFFGGVEPPT